MICKKMSKYICLGLKNLLGYAYVLKVLLNNSSSSLWSLNKGLHTLEMYLLSCGLAGVNPIKVNGR